MDCADAFSSSFFFLRVVCTCVFGKMKENASLTFTFLITKDKNKWIRAGPKRALLVRKLCQFWKEWVNSNEDCLSLLGRRGNKTPQKFKSFFLTSPLPFRPSRKIREVPTAKKKKRVNKGPTQLSSARSLVRSCCFYCCCATRIWTVRCCCCGTRTWTG